MDVKSFDRKSVTHRRPCVRLVGRHLYYSRAPRRCTGSSDCLYAAYCVDSRRRIGALPKFRVVALTGSQCRVRVRLPDLEVRDQQSVMLKVDVSASLSKRLPRGKQPFLPRSRSTPRAEMTGGTDDSHDVPVRTLRMSDHIHT